MHPQDQYDSETQAALVRALVDSPLWELDAARFEGDDLVIEGWALPSETEAAFTANGVPFDSIERSERQDLAGLFWHTPGAGQSGYRCRLANAAERIQDPTLIEIAYANRKTGAPFNRNHNNYFQPEDPLPFPPGANRKRVHGSDNFDSFRNLGRSTFEKIGRNLVRLTSKGYEDFQRVLDWGCGCGNIARHFSAYPEIEFHGADIDDANAAWCRDNLGFGTFQTVPLTPPTGFEDGQFDLIIGISVFTHLSQEQQPLWLQELRRIAAPGGLLAISVHGFASIFRCGSFERYLALSAANGILDVGVCPDLEGAISDAEYYRNTNMLPQYVRSRWSEYFEILDIVPGTVGNCQDLVIMRKPGGRERQ